MYVMTKTIRLLISLVTNFATLKASQLLDYWSDSSGGT